MENLSHLQDAYCLGQLQSPFNTNKAYIRSLVLLSSSFLNSFKVRISMLLGYTGVYA
jgi:hypothetical protein